MILVVCLHFLPSRAKNKLSSHSSSSQLQITRPVCLCLLCCYCMGFEKAGVSLFLCSFPCLISLFFPPPLWFPVLSIFCLCCRALLMCFSHSPCFSLRRGCAVPDGRGPQTDPSAARGDGLYFEFKRFLTVPLSTVWLQMKSFLQ